MGEVAEVLSESEAPRCVLAESPRWDGRRWSWVDVQTGAVWRRTPDSSATLLAHRHGRVSLCHPTTDGEYVIADGLTAHTLRPCDPVGDLMPWASPLALGGWLVNDGCADADGRLWIGTIGPGRTAGSGQLIMVAAGARPSVARSGFHLSNGMAWHPDGSTLFHADSGACVVWAHQIDCATGAVVDSRIHLDFSGGAGIPDGLCTDVEGGLWVACYGTGEVRRHLDGQLERVVTVPTEQVTAVELGGATGTEMLITTAREGFDAGRSAAEPLAGRLFRADAGVVGQRRPPLAERADTAAGR